MNRFLFFIRKLMAWGNYIDRESFDKNDTFWGSLGW